MLFFYASSVTRFSEYFLRWNEAWTVLCDIKYKYFYILQGFPRPLSIKYLKSTSLKNILIFLSFLMYLSNLSIVVYFSGNIFE